nr:retrovirus-related Pol polyprotein from transposon TNT 1-94 [Tanacetum cinerariifolium]
MAGNIVKDMTTNFGKLDKFEGHDFRRLQKKMHFLLTTLKVVYVLTTSMPKLLEDATVEAIRIRAKWENDDYICRGHILNGMSDSLFDVYRNVESVNELWDSLESKYMTEESLNDLSLVQLGSHLRIEESLRTQNSDKGKGKEVGGPSINMTEEGKNKHNKKNKGKKRSNENNSGSSSNKKPKLECWKCGKTGHFKRDCRSGNKKNANAGGSGNGSKDHSLMQLRDGLIPVLQLMFVNIVAGLRNTDRLKTGLYFTWDMYTIKRMLEMSKDDLILAIDENMEKIYYMDDHSNDFPSEIPEPHKGKRVQKAKSYDSDFQLYLVEGSRDQVGLQYSYCYGIEEDPRTYDEAMQSREVAF